MARAYFMLMLEVGRELCVCVKLYNQCTALKSVVETERVFEVLRSEDEESKAQPEGGHKSFKYQR